MDLNTENRLDADGNPAGGFVEAIVSTEHPSGHEVPSRAMYVRWQDGPIGVAGVNGVQVEEVLTSALQRLDFLNTASDGRFACKENVEAAYHIESAIDWLNTRTRRRTREQTEGTNNES